MNANHESGAILIDFHQVKKAAMLIRALNNPYRQKIYEFLLTADNSTVTSIVSEVNLKQSIVSQHLAILRKTKIVSYLKKGKFVYYHLNRERVAEINDCIGKLLENNKPALRKDSV